MLTFDMKEILPKLYSLIFLSPLPIEGKPQFKKVKPRFTEYAHFHN